MKKQLLFLLLVLSFAKIQAQVSGIGYTLSPTVNYTQWNPKLGLKDGFQYGGKLGMSFGEYVELSAVYLLGNQMETDYARFTQISNPQRQILAQNNKSVTFKHYGGELRFNLGSRAFIPFIQLGTGIQELTPENNSKVESIYLSAGGGFSLSIYDRYVLSIFAKNTGLRINPRSLLSTQQQLSALVLPTQFTREDLQNWSLGGALSFHLGGRRSGQLTDIDREVLNRFNGGFAGLSVPVEPQYGQLNFHDDLPYRNTPFVGIHAGLDFGKLLGIRGFYQRALKEEFSTDIDDLQLYGAEMKFKLNEANGIVPYLTVGGGWIDALDNYVGRANGASLEDRPFATGGLGLIVPIGRYVQLFGGGRALLMTTLNDPANNLSSPDQLKVSTSYSAGINLTLGKKPTRGNLVRAIDATAQTDAEIARMQAENAVRIQEIERNFNTKLSTLATEYQAAITRGDSLAAVQKAMEYRQLQTEKTQNIQQQQNATIERVVEIEKIIAAPRPVVETRESRHQNITIPVPEEGEIYIRYGKPSDVNVQTTVHHTDTNSNVGANVNLMTPEQLTNMIRTAVRAEIGKRDSVKVMVHTVQTAAPNIVQTAIPNVAPVATPDIQVTTEIIDEPNIQITPRPKYQYESISAIGGFSFPALDDFHPTVGVRVPFRSPFKSLTFIPEATYDLNDKKLNLAAYAVRPFLRKYSLKLRPYYGAGVAYQGFEVNNTSSSKIKLSVLAGTEFNLKNGLLFADYTNYALKSAHRVVLGYRLPF